MKKAMGVVVALSGLNWMIHAAPLPKVVLHVESQDDVRLAPHRALFYDVAARRLASQWVCVRSEESTPLCTDRVAGIIATNSATGLLLLRAEGLVFSDTASSYFVMRGATSSRLYTLKGSYAVFDQTGKPLVEGSLRATQMSFALTGLDVMDENFLSQIFSQAVSGFTREMEKKPLCLAGNAAPPARPAAETNTVAGISLPRKEEKVVAAGVELPMTNLLVQGVDVASAHRGDALSGKGVLQSGISTPVLITAPVAQRPVLERLFSEVPNVTPADLPQPVIAVDPVQMTIACTPCNPSEQAIFLPDIRLVDQHHVRKLNQRLPVQVASAVEVDGEIVGVAPIHIALQPGDHRIRFEHDGFVTFASTFTVKEAGHLVFPLRMDEQGFKRWTFSVRVFEAIESERVVQDAELQMIKREVRRLQGRGIRLDTSRVDDETVQASLYQMGTQK